MREGGEGKEMKEGVKLSEGRERDRDKRRSADSLVLSVYNKQRTLCCVCRVSRALDMRQPSTGVVGWADSAMLSSLLNRSLSLIVIQCTGTYISIYTHYSIVFTLSVECATYLPPSQILPSVYLHLKLYMYYYYIYMRGMHTQSRML